MKNKILKIFFIIASCVIASSCTFIQNSEIAKVTYTYERPLAELRITQRTSAEQSLDWFKILNRHEDYFCLSDLNEVIHYFFNEDGMVASPGSNDPMEDVIYPPFVYVCKYFNEINSRNYPRPQRAAISILMGGRDEGVEISPATNPRHLPLTFPLVQNEWFKPNYCIVREFSTKIDGVDTKYFVAFVATPSEAGISQEELISRQICTSLPFIFAIGFNENDVDDILKFIRPYQNGGIRLPGEIAITSIGKYKHKHRN